MQVLQDSELRWVSGGECSHGYLTGSEYQLWQGEIDTAYYAMMSDYDAKNDAMNTLMGLEEGTQAYANAAGAYSAALSAYMSSSEYYYTISAYTGQSCPIDYRC